MSPHSVLRAAFGLIAVLGCACLAPANPPHVGASAPHIIGAGGVPMPAMFPYYIGPTIAPTFPIWMPGLVQRPQLDDLSWLPAGVRAPALGREVLRGHEAPVTCVAFSGDGSTLASGSLDKTVFLWDLVARRVKARLRGHTAPVTSLAFSPDGATLATGSHDSSVILWDLRTNRPRATFKSRDARVSAVVFSPDGETLAVGGHDGKIDLWDVSAGRVERTIDGRRGSVWELTFTPDGRTLAAGFFQTGVVLWNAATGQILETRRAWHNSDTASAASLFGNDTLALSRGAEGWIWLQDVKQGQALGFLAGHAGAVRSMTLSSGGKLLASGGVDKTVRVWDLSAELERFDRMRAYIQRTRVPVQASKRNGESEREREAREREGNSADGGP